MHLDFSYYKHRIFSFQKQSEKNVKALKECLAATVKSQSHLGERVPISWTKLEAVLNHIGTQLEWKTSTIILFKKCKILRRFHLFRFYIHAICQPLFGSSRKALWEIHTYFCWTHMQFPRISSVCIRVIVRACCVRDARCARYQLIGTCITQMTYLLWVCAVFVHRSSWVVHRTTE